MTGKQAVSAVLIRTSFSLDLFEFGTALSLHSDVVIVSFDRCRVVIVFLSVISVIMEIYGFLQIDSVLVVDRQTLIDSVEVILTFNTASGAIEVIHAVFHVDFRVQARYHGACSSRNSLNRVTALPGLS